MNVLLIGLGAFAAGLFLIFVNRLHSLAISLVLVAVIYVLFAVLFQATAPWLFYELGGVILFGLFALASVRHGYVWLVAGWGLHVLWDVVLHQWLRQPAFVPEIYPGLCLGFDVVVAGFCLWKVFVSSRDKRRVLSV